MKTTQRNRSAARKVRRHARRNNGVRLLVTSLALICALAIGGGIALNANTEATAESTSQPVAQPMIDTSPAIYVAEKNDNSVVGIITSAAGWSRSTGTQESTVAEGSGVVIADGGYVLTNYHVIEDGSSFQVLMPDGSKVGATLVGSDSSMDLAVVKVEQDADKLTPVSIGRSTDLKVGSTVIAIGNPGGEILAHTVTQGIVSALERSSISGRNTSRNVNYIQHDASISSGNSGGGLFDYQGNLVGINTLKYAGSYYSSSTYEGLGFAIPVESAYPIAQQLIQNGKVLRPQMGVTVATYSGPDEPVNNQGPSSAVITKVNPGSPAEKAGIKLYDFIYAVDGERVNSVRDLTTKLDQYKPGDTVTVTVVRYSNAQMMNNNGYYGNNYYGNYPFGSYPFGGFFGGYDGYGYGYGYDNGGSGYTPYDSGSSGRGTLTVGGSYEKIDIQVTLEILDKQ